MFWVRMDFLNFSLIVKWDIIKLLIKLNFGDFQDFDIKLKDYRVILSWKKLHQKTNLKLEWQFYGYIGKWTMESSFSIVSKVSRYGLWLSFSCSFPPFLSCPWQTGQGSTQFKIWLKNCKKQISSGWWAGSGRDWFA